MGLFTQRPEEPAEWAGLPSEPVQPRSPAETLLPPVADLPVFGLGGAVESVPVAVETDAEDADAE